jgi:probable blue pigment (indigoidine) exporter
MLGMMLVALVMGERLSVPRGERRLLLWYSVLNVTGWMGLATIALVWLSASEGAIIAYTMPVWTALLAWPMLGEKLTLRRVLALVAGLVGVAVLMAGDGLEIGLAKLPGVAILLAGAVLFAYGTVRTKLAPLSLSPTASVAWQVGIGCFPLLLAGLWLEKPDFSHLSLRGWLAMAYMAAIPLCLCYLSWFAALRRLPAAAAAIGTLITPVIGVVAAALSLGEPLGWREVVALGLTLIGIVLAVRD